MHQLLRIPDPYTRPIHANVEMTSRNPRVGSTPLLSSRRLLNRLAIGMGREFQRRRTAAQVVAPSPEETAV